MATVSRFSGVASDDNTDRSVNNDYQAPAYAAAIALSVKGKVAKTIMNFAPITGNATVTVNTVDPLTGNAAYGPFVGDEIVMFMAGSGGVAPVVTFGAGFLPTGTLALTLTKFARISFQFNGANWVEVARSVSA